MNGWDAGAARCGQSVGPRLGWNEKIGQPGLTRRYPITVALDVGLHGPGLPRGLTQRAT